MYNPLLFIYIYVYTYTRMYSVTQGPQGIVFEVTPLGEEVWRYISPVVIHTEGADTAVCYLHQGDTNIGDIGRRSLFK